MRRKEEILIEIKALLEFLIHYLFRYNHYTQRKNLMYSK